MDRTLQKRRVMRYMVIFSSSPTPPADATVIDMSATSELEAIAKAKRYAHVPHPWTTVNAIPWPKGCRGVNQAVKRYSVG